jgi:capping protein (actin filament) muscle Z-line, alpha
LLLLSTTIIDVKKLVGPVLSDEVVANAARNFNNKTLRVVSTPSGEKAVLNPASEVDATHARDNNNTVYSIDHVTLATAEDESGAGGGDEALEMHRAALQSALSAYIASKFTCELAAGTVAAKDGSLHLHICTEKPNLRNFWSGKWTSSWVVAVNGGSASVSGEIKVSFVRESIQFAGFSVLNFLGLCFRSTHTTLKMEMYRW